MDQKLNSLLFVVFGILFIGCANQVRPNGGAKDTQPPQIVGSEPGHGELNVVSSQLDFEFDEFVRVSPSNIVVTPSLTKPLIARTRGKKVSLQFQEDLLQNTTYTIQFSDAIKDITEGNTLLQPTLVFSTGSYIDSMFISGEVIDYSSGDVLPDAIVGLYRYNESDSVVMREKPLYFVKADDQGRFGINNLKNIEYKLFAIQDDNSNLKWDKEEALGIVKRILPKDSVAPTTIYVTAQQDNSDRSSNVSMEQPGKIVWTSPAADMRNQVRILQPTQSSELRYFTRPETSQHFLWFNAQSDTAEVEIISTGRVDTFFLRAKTENVEAFGLSNSKSSRSLSINLNPSEQWVTVFNHPISRFQSENMVLQQNDSVAIVPMYRISNDSLIVDSPWDYGKTYELTLFPGALEDRYGQTNDTINLLRRVKAEDAFGSVQVELNGFDQEQQRLMLQLFDKNREVVHSQLVMDSVLVIRNLEAKAYTLSVFQDENQNNQWDSGNLFLNNLPEIIYHYKGIILVRGNWDINVQLDLDD